MHDRGMQRPASAAALGWLLAPAVIAGACAAVLLGGVVLLVAAAG